MTPRVACAVLLVGVCGAVSGQAPPAPGPGLTAVREAARRQSDALREAAAQSAALREELAQLRGLLEASEARIEAVQRRIDRLGRQSAP